MRKWITALLSMSGYSLDLHLKKNLLRLQSTLNLHLYKHQLGLQSQLESLALTNRDSGQGRDDGRNYCENTKWERFFQDPRQQNFEPSRDHGRIEEKPKRGREHNPTGLAIEIIRALLKYLFVVDGHDGLLSWLRLSLCRLVWLVWLGMLVAGLTQHVDGENKNSGPGNSTEQIASPVTPPARRFVIVRNGGGDSAAGHEPLHEEAAILLLASSDTYECSVLIRRDGSITSLCEPFIRGDKVA